jgi:NitT/TauT family transport system substrate-binding protein
MEDHMPRLRLPKAAILVLTSAFFVFGAEASFAQSSAPQKVKIRLDWKAQAYHAPFYVGIARGFYKGEGIDLEVISGSGSSDTVKQVGSDAVEFGLVDALVLVQAAQQRVPVKSIAAYYQRSPIVLISPKDKPITNPRQLLDSVKLGIKKGSATYQGLIALLSANNIPIERIKLVDVGVGVAPLLVKQVDAVMGYSMDEPISAESAGMPTHILSISDYGVDTYGLTIVSNSKLIQSTPDVVKGFLTATERAMNETIKDSVGAVAAVTRAVEGVDPDREAKVLARALPYWKSKDTEEHGLGWQTETRWQGTIDIARKLGLIETALRPGDVFENTFLGRSAGRK